MFLGISCSITVPHHHKVDMMQTMVLGKSVFECVQS